MSDVDGNEVGRLLYDGYGGVLTSTVPITLTGAVADVPDATTGLVYQGGGRWYDPALGRPLQPNAAGGPPSVPQALNRYAATPLGQPRVAQTVKTSQWYDCCNLFDVAIDLAAYFTGEQLGIEAYLTSWTSSIGHSGKGLPHFARNLNAQGGVRIRITPDGYLYSPASPHPIARHNKNRINWLERRLGNGSLLLSEPEPSQWTKSMNFNISISNRLGFSGKKVSIGEALDGGVVGFGFDAAWQLAQDWGNPYLSTPDKIIRSATSGLVGFAAGLGVAAIVGTGPVGFAVAVGVGWFIEAPISNWIFEKTGRVPTRNLLPLTN